MPKAIVGNDEGEQDQALHAKAMTRTRSPQLAWTPRLNAVVTLVLETCHFIRVPFVPFLSTNHPDGGIPIVRLVPL